MVDEQEQETLSHPVYWWVGRADIKRKLQEV